jgi:hypothetical protein
MVVGMNPNQTPTASSSGSPTELEELSLFFKATATAMRNFATELLTA